jgi:hypothetical protein
MTSQLQDSTTGRRLTEFCRRLVDISQLHYAREFLTGSHVEIEFCEQGIKRFGIKRTDTDVDKMLDTTYLRAFPRGYQVPDSYSGEALRIFTDDVHAGYARLIWESSCTELLHDDIKPIPV